MFMFSTKGSNDFLYSFWKQHLSTSQPVPLHNSEQSGDTQSFTERNHRKYHIYEDKTKLDPKSTQEQAQQKLDEEQKILKNAKRASKIMLGVGAAAVVATTANYLVNAFSSNDKEQNNTPTPTPTPTPTTPPTTPPTPTPDPLRDFEGITDVKHITQYSQLDVDALGKQICFSADPRIVNPENLCDLAPTTSAKEFCIGHTSVEITKAVMRDTDFCNAIKGVLPKMVPIEDGTVYVLPRGDDPTNNYISAPDLANKCMVQGEMFIEKQFAPGKASLNNTVSYELPPRGPTVLEQNRQNSFFLDTLQQAGTDSETARGFYASYRPVTLHQKDGSPVNVMWEDARIQYCDENGNPLTKDEAMSDKYDPRKDYTSSPLKPRDLTAEEAVLSDREIQALVDPNNYVIQPDPTKKSAEEDSNSPMNTVKALWNSGVLLAVGLNVGITLPFFIGTGRIYNNMSKGLANISIINDLSQRYNDGSMKISAPNGIIDLVIEKAKDVNATGISPVFKNKNGKLETHARPAYTFLITHKQTGFTQYSENNIGKLYQIKSITDGEENITLNFEHMNQYSIERNDCSPNTLSINETVGENSPLLMENASTSKKDFKITQIEATDTPEILSLTAPTSQIHGDENTFNITKRGETSLSLTCVSSNNVSDMTGEYQIKPIYPYAEVTDTSVVSRCMAFLKDITADRTLGTSNEPMATLCVN